MAGGLVKTALHGANIGDAVNVIAGVNDYKNARQEGDSGPVSLAKAAGSFAWGEMLFGGVGAGIEKGVTALKLTGGKAMAATMIGNVGFMAAYVGVTVAPKVLSTVWENNRKALAKGYNQKGKLGSGYFNMTETGYTMRQRSLNAIRSNGLNTQSTLGNEARTYFKGSL